MGIFDKIFSKTKVDPNEYNDKLNEAVAIGKEINNLCDRWGGFFRVEWYPQYAADRANTGDYSSLEIFRNETKFVYYNLSIGIVGLKDDYDKYHNDKMLSLSEKERVLTTFLSIMYDKPYEEILEPLKSIIKGQIKSYDLDWTCSCPLPSGMQGEKDCERFIRDIKSRLGIK